MSEAEYVALSAAGQEDVWLWRLLESLKEKQSSATMVQEDNKLTIQMSINPVHHQQMKQISLKYHFTRDLIGNGTISLQHCELKKMLADILAKPLPWERFFKLWSSLGLCSTPVTWEGVLKSQALSMHAHNMHSHMHTC